MPESTDLHGEVSRARLLGFLEIGGESDAWDFKVTLDISGRRQRAELARDILAFANTEQGGHIIFGLKDKTFEQIGLPTGTHVETTAIHNAVSRYIYADVKFVAAEYEIARPNWDGPRRFGIVFIAPYAGVAVPSVDAIFDDAEGFAANEILVRRGAQSCRADQAALTVLLARATSRASRSTEVDEHDTPLHDNLPPRTEIAYGFVGRHRELLLLWEWLRDSFQRRWLVTGGGGRGKTALAYEFATQVRAARPVSFEAVIWLSAKRSRFVEGRVVDVRRPDFWDLPSLLNAIAKAYDLPNEVAGLSTADKKSKVHELLTVLPALVIADDIDSLEELGEAAVEFLTTAAASSRSKVLFTSRSVPRGLSTATTQVEGLEPPDAIAFVGVRWLQYGISEERLSEGVAGEVIEVTDSTPLYIEDLLRLIAVLPTDNAIRAWRGQEGEAVREYALKRQFEMLSADSRRIVMTCSIAGRAMTMTEIQDVTGLSERRLVDAMRAVQNLFLVSQPRLTEGVERFDMNANTSALVVSTYANTDEFKAVRRALEATTGKDYDSRTRSEIADYVNQVISLQRLDRFDDAEATILAALKKHVSHPDLIGQMGVLYSKWKPTRRKIDARVQFARAAQLKCKRASVYALWSDMEIADQRPRDAATAAETGIRLAGPTKDLLFHAGLARMLVAERLKQGLISVSGTNAQLQFAIAEKLLRQALAAPVEIDASWNRVLNARIQGTLVRTLEFAGNLAQAERVAREWRESDPEDWRAATEAQRLRTRVSRAQG